jgi:hypothetical protein
MLVASVPMNELIRVQWMTSALAMPRPSPARTPANSPSVGSVALATLVASTAESPKIAPVDTSKMPATMQIVIAQAMIPSGADWSRMLVRLRSVKNVSVESARPANSARNASRIP